MKTTYYYIAYDLRKQGEVVGIAYQPFGKRGGRKPARWLEPVRRKVTKDEFKQYKFHSYRMTSPSVNWWLDGELREKGLHIESKL